MRVATPLCGLAIAAWCGTSADAQPAAEAAQIGAAVTRPAAAAARPLGTATARSATKSTVALQPPPPPPPPNETEAGPSCSGGLPEPIRVRISAGKSTLINLPEPVTRRTVGDPNVISSRMVSPEVLYLVSGRIGVTNVILQGRSGRCTVLDVAVGFDTEVVLAKLAEVLPNEKGIKVSSAGDSLILMGVVSDALAVERAVSIANAYVRTPNQQGVAPGGASGGITIGPSPINVLANQTAINGAAPLLARVVNLLSVSAAQQVMLEVKVAEVSKTLLDKLGANFSATRSQGAWTYQLLTNFLATATDSNNGVLSGSKDANNRFGIDAKKQDSLIRILAEPNVMAISGQEGSFLAGGKILIPVAQSNSGGTITITLQEKEFGVGLLFTPTVLSDGRINLRVAPEVSELSKDGVGITATGITGTSILPLITTRRASTTVQLFDGQSFAIGGLIKNNITTTIAALPVLGEIPILGALFRSSEFQSEKTELVFIVTPRLVKPLPSDFQLPTDKVGEPNRQGFFLNGRMDSDPAAPAGTMNAPPSKPGGYEIK